MRIALLEDNPANRQYLQTLLALEGHEVFPHSHGHSLLAALQTFHEVSRYDVIIIDLLLPNTLSGLEVMHRLQERFSAQPLPFVVVSALSQKELDRVRVNFPQAPIIQKPFKHEQLFKAIQVVVTRPKA